MKSNFLLKCATLILGFVVFAFGANNIAFQLTQSVLSHTSGFVLVVLTAVIAIRLIPLSWIHVKSVLSRGSMVSTPSSRKNARARLRKSRNRSSRFIGNSDTHRASNFRKKYKSFEDFRGSREFKNSRSSFRKKF